MGIKVTRAVTKNGHYYKAGTVIANPTGFEQSLARLWGWETVTAVAPAKTKPELVKEAKAKGLATSGKSKADLIELLNEE